MSDTRQLMARIAALRQKLEQAPALAPQSVGTAEPSQRLKALAEQVAIAGRQAELLDETVRKLTEDPRGKPELPARLTARARRLVARGGDLLAELRSLAGAFPSAESMDLNDPLACRYREALRMTDTALRTVQAYPESPSVQLRLCEGLEGILEVIAERIDALKCLVERQHHHEQQVAALADLMMRLDASQPVELRPFTMIVDGLRAEAEDSAPVRFLAVTPALPAGPNDKAWVARLAACHGLTTAQVVARLVRRDPEYRSRPFEPILAALLHDVGMVTMPSEVVGKPGPLEDEQKRLIERHTLRGPELAGRLLPGSAWLAEVAAGHHEHLDGTGYPAGLREVQIGPLVRLIAVCSIYAAMSSPRPYRPARAPRTALTDTLLLAEKTVLDRGQAERLLQLSFYPVGSVVELADGSIGVVRASNLGRRDLHNPGRPVVQLLSDPRGKLLAVPRFLDLAECEGRSIVRCLAADERRQLLGQRHPDLCV